jgi:hypothetical protein
VRPLHVRLQANKNHTRSGKPPVSVSSIPLVVGSRRIEASRDAVEAIDGTVWIGSHSEYNEKNEVRANDRHR